MDYTNVTTAVLATFPTQTNGMPLWFIIPAIILFAIFVLGTLLIALDTSLRCDLFNKKEDKLRYTYNNIKCYDRIAGTFSAFVLAAFLHIGHIVKGIYLYPAGKITDGYALTLLAPFVLTYWAIITIFVPIILVLLIALYIPSCIWFVLFELPADFLNGYFKKD